MFSVSTAAMKVLAKETTIFVPMAILSVAFKMKRGFFHLRQALGGCFGRFVFFSHSRVPSLGLGDVSIYLQRPLRRSHGFASPIGESDAAGQITLVTEASIENGCIGEKRDKHASHKNGRVPLFFARFM